MKVLDSFIDIALDRYKELRVDTAIHCQNPGLPLHLASYRLTYGIARIGRARRPFLLHASPTGRMACPTGGQERNQAACLDLLRRANHWLMEAFEKQINRAPRVILALFTVFCLSAVLLFAIGLGWALYEYRFVSSAPAATGTVVAIESRYSTAAGKRQSSQVFSPVIEFQDTTGGKHRFTSSIWKGQSAGFQVGERVPVAYDRSKPDQALIVSFWNIYLGPVLLLVLSAGSFLFAYVFWHLKSRLP